MLYVRLDLIEYYSVSTTWKKCVGFGAQLGRYSGDENENENENASRSHDRIVKIPVYCV